MELHLIAKTRRREKNGRIKKGSISEDKIEKKSEKTHHTKNLGKILLMRSMKKYGFSYYQEDGNFIYIFSDLKFRFLAC